MSTAPANSVAWPGFLQAGVWQFQAATFLESWPSSQRLRKRRTRRCPIDGCWQPRVSRTARKAWVAAASSTPGNVTQILVRVTASKPRDVGPRWNRRYARVGMDVGPPARSGADQVDLSGSLQGGGPVESRCCVAGNRSHFTTRVPVAASVQACLPGHETHREQACLSHVCWSMRDSRRYWRADHCLAII